MYLDDDSVKNLATSWPRLQMLVFACSTTPNIIPRVTLPGLLPLAEHCRDLEQLCLFMHLGFREETELSILADLKTGRGIAQHSLVSLQVGTSTLGDDPEEVATFLRSVFPALRIVKADDIRNTPDWQTLSQLLEQTRPGHYITPI
ncbi:hypothetical protein BDQ12DRAFT_617125 [Crucibulum laeve]|uniref:F-box domain-containing protein n=1 Tax=Crucibulum laeve TaxID=68775 RepID=A0A5C3LHV9_9AGAR|nr:hypothetical protein BDQ12DRAFT_617125 [Crucibulum laeve]